ncbi:MAG: cupin domain-containing protein [Chloroflexi bacterium]|nr:cupin domain-containing protein [Chloroflexota bacterium]
MQTQDTPGQFQTFTVEPPLLEQGKTSTRLVRTDYLNSGVQVVADGGETNLHAHSSQDEIWFVLSGEATFYTEGDRVVGRLGKHQGLLIPHNVPYWFESSSQTGENLVILRFGASVPEAGPDRRIDWQERKWAVSGEPGGAPREVVFANTGVDKDAK